MKCKRLCAWLLSLVMMFSLLPVSAAAKWYGEHNVTVKYVFNDDSPKSKSDDVIKTIASHVGAITPFSVKEAGYNHSAKVTSGKADCSIDDLGFLHVKHVDADSEITVTYTPKDVIYIDQYYDNGSSLVKWNNTHITLNGPDLLKNNAAEAAVIEKTVLTDDMKDYRFLKVNGVTYDFSFASLVPRKSDKGEITDL